MKASPSVAPVVQAETLPNARVGVVVVHFGDPTPTGACVESLRDDPSGVERQVVVIDNSDNLGCETLLGARVLGTPSNRGFGAGANAGVAALGAGGWDAFVILNNDVEVCPGYLAAAAAAVAGAGAGAAAGPLYLERPGGALWYAGGGVNFLLGTVWQAKSARSAARPRRVGFISGAAFAVSPAAWHAVGGFDGRYFLYNEDLDFSLRLRRRGYQLRFVPEMGAVHRVGGATGSARRSALYLEHLTANRLRPFRSRSYRLYLGFLHTGYVLARAAGQWLRPGGEDGRAAAKALIRGHVRALSSIMAEPL